MALAAIGWWPTRRIAGDESVRSMLWAIGLVALIVIVSLRITARRMDGAEAAGRFRIMLAAGLMRMVAIVPLAFGIAWVGDVNVGAFLIWVAIAYIVLIKVETLVLLGWSRRLENKE